MGSNTRVAREERWRRLLSLQSASGLSLREFARRRGLSANTLGYWKYRRRIATAGSAPRIVPVTLIDEPNVGGGELTIEVGDAVLRIPPDFDVERVARVVSLLRRSC